MFTEIPTLSEKFHKVIDGEQVYIKEEQIEEFKSYFKPDVLKMTPKVYGFDVELAQKESDWEKLFK